MRKSSKCVVVKVVGCNMILDFNYKPTVKERNAMKECHFRWSPDKGVWYGKSTPESRKMANSLMYIKDFVKAPRPTMKDFSKWLQSLKDTTWKLYETIANDDYVKNGGDAEEVFMKELKSEFVKQWA